MKRVQVQIVKATEKAILVSAGAKQGWIQKRWLAADGTVSAATFEKAVASAQARQIQRQVENEAAKEERAFRSADHPVRVVRETEKAVAAEVTLRVPGGFEEAALVWFPKSVIGGGHGVALVPGWMIREREAGAGENYKPGGSYERHRFCKGERAELVRGVEIEEAVYAA